MPKRLHDLALGQQDTYGPAHKGKGWIVLNRNASKGDLFLCTRAIRESYAITISQFGQAQTEHHHAVLMYHGDCFYIYILHFSE